MLGVFFRFFCIDCIVHTCAVERNGDVKSAVCHGEGMRCGKTGSKEIPLFFFLLSVCVCVCVCVCALSLGPVLLAVLLLCVCFMGTVQLYSNRTYIFVVSYS
jgi:hypothetical protein